MVCGGDGRAAALELRFGLRFVDLYERDGLVRVDAEFLAFLGDADPTLSSRLGAARQAAKCDRAAHAVLALQLAPHFEDFIAELFSITGPVTRLRQRSQNLAAIHEVKRTFVQRRAVKNKTAEDAAKVDGPSIAAKLAEEFTEPLNETNFARHVSNWLESEQNTTAN